MPCCPFLEINNWGKVVDTQIKRQDIEAFRIWKKELNHVMKITKGEGIVNYLKGLHASGRMVQARMGIPENDATVDSLKEISMVCIYQCALSNDTFKYIIFIGDHKNALSCTDYHINDVRNSSGKLTSIDSQKVRIANH